MKPNKDSQNQLKNLDGIRDKTGKKLHKFGLPVHN